MSTITGIFIPFADGSYTSADVITEVDSNEINSIYYQLEVLNPANPAISGDVEDIFVFAEGTNKRYYSQMSTATQNLINLPQAKQDALAQLDAIYKKSQICIFTNCGTDPDSNNAPITIGMIMQTSIENGDLDLFARQQNLAQLYGASFIQGNGYSQNQDGSYSPNGLMYAGYLKASEWLKIYGTIINQSSVNYITYQKLQYLINYDVPDLQTLQYVVYTLPSYFTIPFTIDYTATIARTNGDPLLLKNLQANLVTIQTRIYTIMAGGN